MTDGGPFVLLTFIAAPAVLTNASSVLALNTANRYGRAFDRAKEIGLELDHTRPEDVRSSFRLRLLEVLVRRARLLLTAQAAFYWTIGLFVLSALISLLGAAGAQNHPHWLLVFTVCAFAVGLLATGTLVFGCTLLVRETRLAMVSLHEEKMLLFTLHSRAAPEPHQDLDA
jgi:hypothetical protein